MHAQIIRNTTNGSIEHLIYAFNELFPDEIPDGQTGSTPAPETTPTPGTTPSGGNQTDGNQTGSTPAPGNQTETTPAPGTTPSDGNQTGNETDGQTQGLGGNQTGSKSDKCKIIPLLLKYLMRNMTSSEDGNATGGLGSTGGNATGDGPSPGNATGSWGQGGADHGEPTAAQAMYTFLQNATDQHVIESLRYLQNVSKFDLVDALTWVVMTVEEYQYVVSVGLRVFHFVLVFLS
jgi:hypothetical protein